MAQTSQSSLIAPTDSQLCEIHQLVRASPSRHGLNCSKSETWEDRASILLSMHVHESNKFELRTAYASLAFPVLYTH
jgi:hypothetical protein